MHCFPVVASRVVEPAPEQFVSLTLDGQLTIDPVNVDLQMAFNIFIIVSCLCHICKHIITLYTSCQAGMLSILDAKEFFSQFPFIWQWGSMWVNSLDLMDNGYLLYYLACCMVFAHYAINHCMYGCITLRSILILQIDFGNSSNTFDSGTVQVIVPQALRPPSFDMDIYNFTVPENAFDGYTIGRLAVTIETCKFK